MPVPQLVPTAALNATVDDVTYHIQGELVPVLMLELDRMPVYFEHHILLWKDPQLDIHLKSLKGGFKRMLAGMPVFMTEVAGPGRIAFSRDGAGHIFPIHLASGQSVDVREHQFLAATSNVDVTPTWVKGAASLLFGGTGLFIDTFSTQGDGCIWVHGYGNVFEVTLGPGEAIDIEPGGWIYKDPAVTMKTMFQSLKSSFFASAGSLFWNRFTGPGRVGLQSMYSAPFGDNSSGGGTSAAGTAIGIAGRLLGG